MQAVALFELLGVLGRPPVVQVALGVELAAFVVEAVRQLVADHHADAAEVDGVVSAVVEERRLQNAGREVDVVHLRVVVGVDRGRRHVPLAAVHRLADLVQLRGGTRTASARQLLPMASSRVIATLE